MPVMTELEEQLAAPGGAALRDQLLAELDALELRLRWRIAASVPRDDYPTLAACADATAAAREVLAAWPVGAAQDQPLPQGPGRVAPAELAPAPVPDLQFQPDPTRRTP